MEKSYIVIPIYSDPFLHPLHKNNKLSLLYTRELDLKEGTLNKGEFIPQLHPDCSEMLQDYSHIYEGKGIIITPDSKNLQPIFPEHKKILCINQCHWWLNSRPFENNIRNNAIDFLSNKYYNVKKLNEIVPISKHREYCDELSEQMYKWLKPKINDLINDEGWFARDGSIDKIQAFWDIEKQGVKVTDDVCDIFDVRVKKHISNGKLYSNYNLWTTTGRPSNSYGTVNFAALTKEQRKAFIPENDSLVEFDFDAYHLRLIANLVDYDFGKESVHEHFAKIYNCSYDESKAKTFQILYGGIREEHKKISKFFDKTYEYINKKWLQINRFKYVVSTIYRRKLFFENYTDLNRNKLFNYLIQGYETEMNIKKILSIQDYLLREGKKTKLVLYGYDSFLFDFSEQDGVKTLKEIKKILEDDCDLPTKRVDYKPVFLTKSKMGSNYSEMKDITKRL
tara:strand:- start:1966 stop:3318 length:1353 start_codon:yes stop_codon:yes gene_type:complete